MTLGKAEILSARDAQIVAVDVPEWGGSVNVRAMTGTQRDRFECAVSARRGKDGHMDGSGLRALLVSLSACDDAGAGLFTESDMAALGEKSAVALQRVFDAAAKLNGLTGDSSEEASADFTADRS